MKIEVGGSGSSEKEPPKTKPEEKKGAKKESLGGLFARILRGKTEEKAKAKKALHRKLRFRLRRTGLSPEERRKNKKKLAEEIADEAERYPPLGREAIIDSLGRKRLQKAVEGELARREAVRQAALVEVAEEIEKTRKQIEELTAQTADTLEKTQEETEGIYVPEGVRKTLSKTEYWVSESYTQAEIIKDALLKDTPYDLQKDQRYVSLFIANRQLEIIANEYEKLIEGRWGKLLPQAAKNELRKKYEEIARLKQRTDELLNRIKESAKAKQEKEKRRQDREKKKAELKERTQEILTPEPEEPEEKKAAEPGKPKEKKKEINVEKLIPIYKERAELAKEEGNLSDLNLLRNEVWNQIIDLEIQTIEAGSEADRNVYEEKRRQLQQFLEQEILPRISNLAATKAAEANADFRSHVGKTIEEYIDDEIINKKLLGQIYTNLLQAEKVRDSSAMAQRAQELGQSIRELYQGFKLPEALTKYQELADTLIREKTKNYTQKAFEILGTGGYAPKPESEQRAFLRERMKVIMGLGESPDALYGSPTWNSLIRWLETAKPEIRKEFSARMSFLRLKYSVEGRGSFDGLLAAGSLISGEKISTMLKIPEIAAAYDAWEQVATETEKTGKKISDAQSPKDLEKLKEEMAIPVIKKICEEDKIDFDSLPEKEKKEIISKRMDEAKTYIEEARVLFFLMRGGTLDKPPKDWWAVHHRLENYFQRLWGSGIGSPVVVENTVGQQLYTYKDKNTKEWQPLGHKIGLGVTPYYNVLFSKLSPADLEELGFKKSKTVEVKKVGQYEGEAVVFKRENEEIWAFIYKDKDQWKLNVIHTNKISAETLSRASQEAPGSTPLTWVVSHLKDAEALRKHLEETGFFDAPPGAYFMSTALKAELLQVLPTLMSKTTHLDELYTEQKKWQMEHPQEPFPGKIPGKIYKEDFFYAVIGGLAKTAKSKEGREEFPGYRMFPNLWAMLMMTEAANERMITPEQKNTLEKNLFKTSMALSAQADLLLFRFRVPVFRNMLVASIFWELLKRLFSYGLSETR
jgi:hypothetical protein